MSSPPEVLVHKYGSYCWRAKVWNWLVKFCEMILTRETKVSYSFTATTMEPEVSWNILLRASPAAPPKGPQTGYGGAGAKKLTQSLPQNQKVASLAHQFSRRPQSTPFSKGGQRGRRLKLKSSAGHHYQWHKLNLGERCLGVRLGASSTPNKLLRRRLPIWHAPDEI